MSFHFIGMPPSSKSLANRALVTKSYFPQFQIQENSQADDVKLMRKAIENLSSIDCGLSGTVLRFMALRASRKSGRFQLSGGEKLFSRPQDDLIHILNQLGVQTELSKNSLTIQTKGWKLQGDALLVHGTRSSQFASSVILNSWGLPFDLFMSVTPPLVSSYYLNMTIKLMMSFGMEVKQQGLEIMIPKNQKLSSSSYTVEPDLSSAFSLAALAAVTPASKVILKPFPEKSLQPDAVFPLALRDLGVDMELKKNTVSVHSTKSFCGLFWNCSETPDLFCVLTVLAALSFEESLVYGAPQLQHKESHRIEKMSELLEKIQRPYEKRGDGLRLLKIQKPNPTKVSEFSFDSDNDHRLVMAGLIAKRAGYPVYVLNTKAVSKSFPEFLDFYSA